MMIWDRLTLFLAACVLAGPALCVDQGTPVADEPAVAVADTDAADLAKLTARLDELRKLASTMDPVIANLRKITVNAIAAADAAQDLDERAAHEKLYREAGARLAELRTRQAQIRRLTAKLSAKLKGPPSNLDGN